jgi:SAM-dependent methyltransferase
MTANADQIEFWNGDAGETWVNHQDRMDVQLEPLGKAVLAKLAVQAGERVLDVGCGGGTTTARLAAAGAKPTGIDISGPMLLRARERNPALDFVEADAQTHDLGAAAFDAVFSRFGVMFFDDPVAAFANLARATKPGGRLAFVCWRPTTENPLFTVPMAAAADARVPMPDAPADPFAPGPFAFADRDRTARILAEAGWTDVAIEPHDAMIGGNNIGNAVQLALQIGPLGRLLREWPEFRTGAVSAVWDALTKHLVDGKVMLASATWIVSARVAAR